MHASSVFESLAADVLESALDESQGKSRALDLENSGGPLKAFVDESGAMGLWIPYGLKDSRLRPDTKSRDITLKPLSHAATPLAELRMTNSRLESVFYTFVEEYLESVVSDPENAVTKVSAQLNRWRSLFVSRPSETLSEEKELGLISELETLIELHLSGIVDPISKWTGPSSSRHDFQLPGLDIECKASRSLNGLTIGVNGSRQLIAEEDSQLHLVVRRYEATPNGDVSLRKLIRSILDEPSIPSDEFLHKLLTAGVPVQTLSQDEEEGRRYSRIDKFVFEVGDDFPRLNHEALPDRVVQVSYKLDLNPPEEIPGYIMDGQL